MIRITVITFTLLSVFPAPCKTQPSCSNETLATLDSIRNSQSVARHFAEIYYRTTAGAIGFFSDADSQTRYLMTRMEKRFAFYFFRSALADRTQRPIPFEWQAYFSDRSGPPLRYVLYGINAHINGDIWQALTNEFTLEELQQLKPSYFAYQKGLLKDYDSIYKFAYATSPRLRLFHLLSLGLDKWYGKVLLSRWRKRQMHLAELYFINEDRFRRKLKRVHRKMTRLNDNIRRNI